MSIHRFLLFLALFLATASTPFTWCKYVGKEMEVFPVFVKWHVYAVNGLSNNNTLFVHCKSSDDDLGGHSLSSADNFTWSFRTNFLHSTLYWCYMHKDDTHASFNVFWQDMYLFEKCNWKNCIWIAKDDGIYIKNFANCSDELRYKWEAPGWW